MELKKAIDMAIELMDKYGLIRKGWYFDINDRFVRTAGQCSYKKKTISLPTKYVSLNSEESVRQVILHEVAHALVGPGHHHGSVWKRQAVAIGALPRACTPKGNKYPDERYKAQCPCGKVVMDHRRTSNRRFRCCRTPVVWQENKISENFAEFKV